MASTGSIFFAGVGSTFAILAIGFGGGFLMANSTLHDGSAQKRASSEPPPAVRVVLPASAEPASQVTAAGPVETPAPATTPEQQATPQGIPNEIQTQEKDKQAERADQRKAEVAERRRKRYAERKARREAARAKQEEQREQQQQEARRPEQPGIMAFDADNEQPRPGGFFGN